MLEPILAKCANFNHLAAEPLCSNSIIKKATLGRFIAKERNLESMLTKRGIA